MTVKYLHFAKYNFVIRFWFGLRLSVWISDRTSSQSAQSIVKFSKKPPLSHLKMAIFFIANVCGYVSCNFKLHLMYAFFSVETLIGMGDPVCRNAYSEPGLAKPRVLVASRTPAACRPSRIPIQVLSKRYVRGVRQAGPGLLQFKHIRRHRRDRHSRQV